MVRCFNKKKKKLWFDVSFLENLGNWVMLNALASVLMTNASSTICGSI